MRRRARERQEKREDMPILKRMHATFCGFSRGCTAKNGLCEGSVWGNWDSREGQQPF